MNELWKMGERLWQEDDATLQDPTSEKVGQAWQPHLRRAPARE
jgi:hypothetical protein